MADDLANHWGCQYTSNIEKGRPITKVEECFNKLKRAIKLTTNNQFSLHKVVANGSDANYHAIGEATGGQNHLLLIGAGSYLAGNKSVLQNWSSTKIDSVLGLSVIKVPDELTDCFGKTHTVALPYFIPCETDNQLELEQFETQCFTKLHIILLQFKAYGTPVKALMMEIVLAGCGAIMTDRAMEKMGQLCEHHQVHIIVDEIMTGGRIGPTMLLTQSMPECFKKNVTHITLGKWPDCGLLLRSRAFDNSLPTELQGNLISRFTSTSIDCIDTTQMWKTVDLLLPTISDRRSFVLNCLKLHENQVWGKGLMIFSCRRRLYEVSSGFPNRFLPQIVDVKVDKIRLKKEETPKSTFALIIKQQITEWINFNDISIPGTTKQFASSTWHLCSMLSKPEWNGNAFTNKEALEVADKQKIDRKAMKHSIDQVSNAGMIEIHYYGNKRVRKWRVNPIFHVTNQDDHVNNPEWRSFTAIENTIIL